jgi:hypothetical protein
MLPDLAYGEMISMITMSLNNNGNFQVAIPSAVIYPGKEEIKTKSKYTAFYCLGLIAILLGLVAVSILVIYFLGLFSPRSSSIYFYYIIFTDN